MKKHIVAVALATTALAPVAAVAGPGYDYVEVAYVSINLDNGPTLDGFGIGGSFSINEQFHVVGQYGNASKSPLTLTETAVGLGYRLGMSDTTDFVVRAGWVQGRVKITNLGSASDNGWFAQAGFRSMLSNQFELNGFVTHADASGSETSLDLGGVYHFNQQFGATLGVSFSDDATVWTVGGRFSF